MKRVLKILAVVSLVSAAAPARAQTTVTFEPLLVADKDGVNPSIEGTFAKSVEHSAWGLGGFWWVTKDWAEAYAGPTWTHDAVSLGLGVGAEQQGGGKNVRLRYALSLGVDVKLAYLNACVEHNTGLFRNEQEGLWYDVVAAYRAAPFGIGWRARRGIGAGPYLEAKIERLHSRPWISWMAIDPEHPSDDIAPRVFAGWMIEL